MHPQTERSQCIIKYVVFTFNKHKMTTFLTKTAKDAGISFFHMNVHKSSHSNNISSTLNKNSPQPNPLRKLCTENHISTVLICKFSKLTTFTSPFIMAFSHELQPLGPIVFSGPLQPSTQFSWHG